MPGIHLTKRAFVELHLLSQAPPARSLSQVTAMIARASNESPPEPGVPPKLPLIRLRVDYTGFSTINAQRFGQRFVNKVANPQDLLIWHKAAVRR